MLFFLIIIILYLLSLIIYLSKIKIEIDTLKIEKNKILKINDFKIKLYLVIGKLKWLKLEISKEKLENSKNVNLEKIIKKISSLDVIDNLKGRELFKNRNIVFEALKDAKIKLERLNLNATIGLDNIIILTYLVAILDIILSIRLAKKANKISSKDYQYKIIPYKTKEIYFNLSINCIISIKIANIINIVLKKRGKENDRTSNRVFNGNSHEQYTRYGGRKYHNRRANIYR